MFPGIIKDNKNLEHYILGFQAVFKANLTDMTFSLITASLTTLSVSHFPTIHKMPFPSFKGRGHHNLHKKQ
jgi:hypothetical protein